MLQELVFKGIKMADKKISQLTASTLPLAGTEVLPIVQNGSTVKVTNNDLRPKQIQSNTTSGVLQVTGPAAASTRVMTTPDENFTVARTDAAQSFTGDQTLSTGNLVIGTSGKGITDSTAATKLNFTATGVGVNTTAPIVANQTAGAFAVGRYDNQPTLGVISDRSYMGANSATDLFKIALSDDYGVTLIEVEIAGRGNSGTPFYFSGKRYISVNGGSSITVGTLGTDINSGNLTVDFTWISGNSFKCTVTQTATGVAAFLSTSLYVTAGGGGDNTAGYITELSYL